MILVPVKSVEHAKQRLSPVLDSAERSALARAMLEDVLHTLASFQLKISLETGCQAPRVAVVTSDSHARQLTRELSFEIIADRANAGETEAVARATRVCEASGVTSLLVIPADIPLLGVSELDAVFAAAPAEGAVLVPAWDGRGTNAALRRPPNLFILRFGDDSFEPHLRAARATGKPCVVLRLPGIALDVDTPEDLALLLAEETRTRTQRLLRAWNIVERISRAARL